MKYKLRRKDLLAEKDPATILRKVKNMTPLQCYKVVVRNDRCFRHVAKVLKENPDLKKKIQDETKKKKA